MNATISIFAEKLFDEAWGKLTAKERDRGFADRLIFGTILIEVRDDGSARLVDPAITLEYRK